MNYFIGIDTLVSNAFIELYPTNCISYGDIKKYGEKVTKNLESKGHRVLLILDKNLIKPFLMDNKMYFNMEPLNNEYCFVLKQNITPFDLIRKFRMHLDINLLTALTDKDTINLIFKSNDKEKILTKKCRF